MGDGWRILDLTAAYCTIDVERGVIVVQTQAGEHDRVVAADIALVLRGYGVRAVLSAGLVSSLGVSHSHRANPFNLVADLMEPFRPAVDSAVLNLPPYSSLRKPETKKLLAGSFEAPFGRDGLTVASALAGLARRYGRFAEGERDTVDVMSWQGVAKE